MVENEWLKVTISNLDLGAQWLRQKKDPRGVQAVRVMLERMAADLRKCKEWSDFHSRIEVTR